MVESAGLLITYNNKILLAHPSKRKLRMGTYTIPKGKLEKGETHLEAAIRETREEVGLNIDVDIIDKTPHVIHYVNEYNVVYKMLTYYVVKLEEELLIDDGLLQLSEVDWAGYLNIDDARMRIFWRFEEMLEYIK